MLRLLAAIAIPFFVLTSCGHSYYIVRHAEKAAADQVMGSDVPLSGPGKVRAEALRDILKGKKVSYIFSTNTIRTKSTVQPCADFFQLPVEIYGPRPDSSFVRLLKTKKKNTLIVGHSNTVDDIVNMLCGEKKVPGDLAETQYDNLFIVKMKNKKMVFTQKKYGKPSE